MKSCSVRAPAGSGKTERLARRYIELLRLGCPPERILTITFTEKAAAEMKQRIFNILKDEDRTRYEHLRRHILRLRITTIHAFCFSLVQRFALELGLEPDLATLDEPSARDLWANTHYDVLLRLAQATGPGQPGAQLLDLITRKRMSGWQDLTRDFGEFFKARGSIERAVPPPQDFALLARLARVLAGRELGAQLIPGYSGLFPAEFDADTCLQLRPRIERVKLTFLTTDDKPRVRGKGAGFEDWCVEMNDYWLAVQSAADQVDFRRRFRLFQDEFLREYEARKQRLGAVDFGDMERFAYDLLTGSDQWSNILMAFDEHTDHILVDEFQDTSYRQWGIIDKLTEEWRAGAGRKTEQGLEPTVFMVGDDKQSIYLFRNAHAEVFTDATAKLGRWLGPERFETETIENNFRSLGGIIDFANHVFARLMKPGPEDPAWCTPYSPFRRQRKNDNPGRVELLLVPGDDLSAPAQRRLEAELIARKIQSIAGRPLVYDRSEQPVPCDYRHITMLLRDRTHLAAYEQALTDAGIPYLVQGGTGFYEAAEVRLLRAVLAVLVNPFDDFSLYALLKSPFFNVPERDLFFTTEQPGNTFYDKLRAWVAAPEASDACRRTAPALLGWLNRLGRTPLTEILDSLLTETNAWQLFWEPQVLANVRKFLALVEGLENAGTHPLRIKAVLDTNAGNEREPKANVDTRGQNAVQIMTIHAAKGLQFPVVICPAIEHNLASSQGRLLIQEESEELVTATYLSGTRQREQDPAFQLQARRELEEAKRLFYVVCTRPRDALFLTGVLEKDVPKSPSWLAWLWSILELERDEDRFLTRSPRPFFSIAGGQERSDDESAPATVRPAIPAPGFQVADALPVRRCPEPCVLPMQVALVPATGEKRNYARTRREDAPQARAFGVVMHRILELISLGELGPDDRTAVDTTAARLFTLEGVPPEPEAVQLQLAGLRRHDLLHIILPQPNARAELPFFMPGDESIVSGRIDRLILRDDCVEVYDYKTFPVQESELPALVEEHRPQLQAYMTAAVRLYSNRPVRGYILFTALPRLVPVD